MYTSLKYASTNSGLPLTRTNEHFEPSLLFQFPGVILFLIWRPAPLQKRNFTVAT